MLLKVIKEIKYDYYYLVKTSSNIKINIMKDKVDNLIGFDITNKSE